jgi:F0F1-type ATP synthase assembly protein I
VAANSTSNSPWVQIVVAIIGLISAVAVAWIANRAGVSTGQQQAEATAASQIANATIQVATSPATGSKGSGNP